ncbi:uncharacterized, partial [Tachysurus ichikawai]
TSNYPKRNWKDVWMKVAFIADTVPYDFAGGS